MTRVNIVVEEDLWKSQSGFDVWTKICDDLYEHAVKKVYSGSKKFLVNILLTNSEEIQKLNRNFRNKDSSTNVLSFPQFEKSDICKIDTLSSSSPIELGDIAMSYSDIMRESVEFGIPFFNRCSHLFVHGVLHLFGFDHINQEEMETMENLEIEILREFDIENPYILKGDNK